MSKIKIDITVMCPHCDYGKIEVGPVCWKPASECCGGCYEEHQCTECDGDGEVTFTLDEDAVKELLFILEDKDPESFWSNVKSLVK